MEELRGVPVFAGLPDEVLVWLAGEGEVLALPAGGRLITEGDPADQMFAVLSGAIQIFTVVGGQLVLFDTFRAGRVGGLLPYSRLTRYPGRGVAVEPSRIWRLGKEHFPEMLRRSPELGQGLVALMSDRVRESTRTQEQHEKMLALGKLAAGLAHELNNPAAAVRRAAASLRERLGALPGLTADLLASGLLPGDLLKAAALLDAVGKRPPAPPLSALARSEREDELADWLSERGAPAPGDSAEVLLDAGFAVPDLELLEKDVPERLPAVVGWIAAVAVAGRLAAEIASAAGRMSELVASVKTYSHLDRAPDKEPTDVREGIDSTLVMLAHELKVKAVRVVREYAPDLPAVTARPGELNQVWTNLLDNAIDALPAEGGELRVEAGREGDLVAVRVIDDGPGIPPAVQPRVFEPFFTTKEVGEGTGLGLDIVRRIVRQHAGDVSVESRPGRTVFTVRLPVLG